MFQRRSQNRCAHGLLSPLVANKMRTGICAANARWSSPPPPSDSSSGWGATNKILSDSEKRGIKDSIFIWFLKTGKNPSRERATRSKTPAQLGEPDPIRVYR